MIASPPPAKSMPRDELERQIAEHWREMWDFLVACVCERDAEASSLVEKITGQPADLVTPRGQILARMKAGPGINPPDWERWAAELDRLAGDAYGEGSAIKNTGPDAWRSMFDDGLSPAEALIEDMDCWD